MIEHEDDLRNQRLGYLLTLNGLLFTALAFAWKTPSARPLVLVLAGMGILAALSSVASMRRSDAAIRALRVRAPALYESSWVDDSQRRTLADLQGIPVAFSSNEIHDLMKHHSGDWKWEKLLQPWRALPLIFLIAWIAIVGLSFLYL